MSASQNGNRPRGDLSNKKKKSALRKARKKELRKKRKMTVNDKRDARGKERREHLADGLNKEKIYTEEAQKRQFPKKEPANTTSQQENYQEKEKPKFKPGAWSKIFLREQEEKSNPIISLNDRIVVKAKKKKELRPLPTNPEAIKALVISKAFKPSPSKGSLAKRFPLANYSE